MGNSLLVGPGSGGTLICFGLNPGGGLWPDQSLITSVTARAAFRPTAAGYSNGDRVSTRGLMTSGGALLDSGAFLDLSVWELRPAPRKSLELMSDSYPKEGLYFKGGLGSRGLGFGAVPQGINLAGATSSSRSKEIQHSGALLISQGWDSKRRPTCAGSLNIDWSFLRAEARALIGIVTLKLRSLASA